MPRALQVTVRCRDGRVLKGYTPAFDPADGCLWYSPAPNSPAGSVLTLDRVKVVLLEPLDGLPVPLPAATPDDGTCGVHVHFSDGEDLRGRQEAHLPGRGLWLQPDDDPRARAFVPEDAITALEMFDTSGFQPVVSSDVVWSLGTPTSPGADERPPEEDPTQPPMAAPLGDPTTGWARAPLPPPPVRVSLETFPPDPDPNGTTDASKAITERPDDEPDTLAGFRLAAEEKGEDTAPTPLATRRAEPRPPDRDRTEPDTPLPDLSGLLR